jgi:hypothetical protein
MAGSAQWQLRGWHDGNHKSWLPAGVLLSIHLSIPVCCRGLLLKEATERVGLLCQINPVLG